MIKISCSLEYSFWYASMVSRPNCKSTISLTHILICHNDKTLIFFFFSSIKNAFQPLGMNIRVRAALSRLIFYITIRSDCIKCSKDSLAIISMELMKWNVIFHVDFFRFMIMSGHLFVYTHIPFYYIIVINTDTCVIVIFSFFIILLWESDIWEWFTSSLNKKKEFCIASKQESCFIFFFFFCIQLLNNDLKSLYCHFIHWLWQTLNFK